MPNKDPIKEKGNIFLNEKEQIKQSKKFIGSNEEIEAQKIADGWKWIETTDRGIKYRKLVKPE